MSQKAANPKPPPRISKPKAPPSPPSKSRKPHREICALCYEVSRIGFWVPNDIWEAAVHRQYQNSIICLRCFTRLADERSVEWDKEIKFFPISWITQEQTIKRL